jgi:hypothetical protein
MAADSSLARNTMVLATSPTVGKPLVGPERASGDSAAGDASPVAVGACPLPLVWPLAPCPLPFTGVAAGGAAETAPASTRATSSSAGLRESVMRSMKSRAVVPLDTRRSESMAANTVRMRGDSMGPGNTVFTRMPRGPSCAASRREKVLSAALGTTYAVRP